EYFDTDERATYWQKQFGVPNRRRVRGRGYGRSDGSIPPSAFIEVKHKLDGQTVKRRLPVALEDLPVFSEGRIPEGLAEGEVDGRVLAEIHDLVVNGGS